MSSQPLRWGILGTGMIAAKLADQLPRTPAATLRAVGSRSVDSARRFTDRHGGRPLGSYQAVLDDPGVDAVYVALPNDLHEPWTLRALEAGKHVLCEKPLAWTEASARRMFEAAERADRHLVEAFMYRLHPGIAKLVELVRGGAIGPLRLIRTSFTFNRGASADDNRYRFEQGGGALLDVGCYCVHLARLLAAAEPDDLTVHGRQHELGVDDCTVGILRFPGDTLAHFGCGMTVHEDRATTLLGTDGAITLTDTWFDPATLEFTRNGTTETLHAPAPLPPYALELERFAATVRGEAEPWITPADSIAQARTLQTLHTQLAAAITAH